MTKDAKLIERVDALQIDLRKAAGGNVDHTGDWADPTLAQQALRAVDFLEVLTSRLASLSEENERLRNALEMIKANLAGQKSAVAATIIAWCDEAIARAQELDPK